jgi:hypothetical protein
MQAGINERANATVDRTAPEAEFKTPQFIKDSAARSIKRQNSKKKRS